MTHSSHTRDKSPDRMLHRSGENRIFAGVAGGLGEHLGINAWWFRWAFILLMIFGGVGLLIYLIAWVVIPGPGEETPIAGKWIEGVDWSDGGAIFGVVLVGVAGVLLLSRVIDVSGTLVLAGVMFVVGLLLYRGDLKIPTGPGRQTSTSSEVISDDSEAEDSASSASDSSSDDSAGAAQSSVSAESAGVAIVGGPLDGGGDSVDRTAPPLPPSQPRPPRERSMLGRLTIAVGLIVLASMALVDLSELAVDIEPMHYFAAAVAVLGSGLLIGSFIGRARWLIIIGVFIVPVLWFSMLLPTSWDFSIGEFSHRPVAVEDVDGPYEQGIGQMTINLTGLSDAELAEIESIQASLGLGEMIVRVPADVGIELNAELGAGEVSGPFNTRNGVGIDMTSVFGPEPTILTLDLEVGAGVIKITGPGSIGFNDALMLEGSN